MATGTNTTEGKAGTGWPWPRPTDDGRAQHLIPGTALPRVALHCACNPDARTPEEHVMPAAIDGRIVLIVYPWTGGPGRSNPVGWDETPGAHGSTPELEGFQRLAHGFDAINVSVFAVSAQEPGAQRDFARRAGITFPLLSDQDFELQSALRLPIFETGGTKFLSRLTVIAKHGVIERVYYPVHPPDTHAREVLYWCGVMRDA
ncbi:MAG TPA: redoxin domain-containing protein [Hyphomicrobiaceae bacterium]|nr:redoxin domain-containing protein [Hyphomicrobiaceae bacterium]